MNRTKVLINLGTLRLRTRRQAPASEGRAIVSTDRLATARDPIAALLRRAIVNEELALRYQPLVDARSRRVIAAEALVCWPSSDLGPLPEGAVLPLAEQCGLIQPLTLWVLNQALSQCHAWKQAGTPLRASVNLSPLCLQDPRFARRVAIMLRAWDLPPASLAFELAPSETPVARACVGENVERLRGMGVALLLDRFGHGPSGLDRLQRLPVDGLKFDPALTQGYPANAVKRAIVEGMLAMARTLGCQAIATGIDSEAAFEHLAQAGFDALQGDGIGLPLPADAFTSRWLNAKA